MRTTISSNILFRISKAFKNHIRREYILMLFYHIWLYSMITYPPTGVPRWCRKMPTGATYRAAQNCNGMFSKTLVPGNNRKKTITGLSNKHHFQDFLWWILGSEFDQALNIKRSVWGFFLSCLRFPCQEVPLGKQIEVTVGLHCWGKADQDSLNFEGFKSGRSSKSSKKWVEKKSLACLEMK